MILITFSLLLQLGHFGFTGGQLDNLGTSSTCSDDIVYHDATIFLKLFLYHHLWLIWHLCFINLAKFRRKVQFRKLKLFTLGIFFLFKTKGLFKILYEGAYSGGTKMRCGIKNFLSKMLNLEFDITVRTYCSLQFLLSHYLCTFMLCSCINISH